VYSPHHRAVSQEKRQQQQQQLKQQQQQHIQGIARKADGSLLSEAEYEKLKAEIVADNVGTTTGAPGAFGMPLPPSMAPAGAPHGLQTDMSRHVVCFQLLSFFRRLFLRVPLAVSQSFILPTICLLGVCAWVHTCVCVPLCMRVNCFFATNSSTHFLRLRLGVRRLRRF